DWWTKTEYPPVSMNTGLTIATVSDDTPPLGDTNRSACRSAVSAGFGTNNQMPDAVKEVVIDVTTDYISDKLPSLYRVFAITREYCQAKSPAGILCGVTDSPEIQVIKQAASESNTPVVAFQHGGNYGYNWADKLRFGDLKVPDVFCTWGKGVTDHLQNRVETLGTSTELTTLGYAKTDLKPAEGERKQPSESDTLLYVATGLRGDVNYGPGYWHDDTEYYRYQRTLFENLELVDVSEILFKPHYKDKVSNPITKDVDSEFDIQTVRSKDLTNHLPDADVVLIDYPSTTLLETMLAEKPIVYLDIGWYQWVSEGKQLLSDCVYWINQGDRGWQQALERSVRRALETGPKGSYQSFLSRYSDPEVDFSSLDDRLFET
ncbi:MAG: hypothetical protein ABEI52_09515, partial [Halobacteriaceae archaeon]